MKETILKIEGKIVGKLVGNEYVTTRKREKHFMFKFQGYGISERVLSFLKSRKVMTIKILADDKILNFQLSEYLNSPNTYINEGDVQKFVTITEKHNNMDLNKWNKEVN